MESPPPVIAGTYVVACAHVDDTVTFEQTNTLNVNGSWLGPVPCLALCQDFETGEYLIQHCSAEWEPLGVTASYSSVDEAKRRIERSYHGLQAKWINSSVTRDEALASYEAELKSESCCFCGRDRRHVRVMIGDSVRICNLCVESFYREVHGNEET